MNAILQRRLRTVDLRVHLHPVSGEHLPFADESFDCVVSTLVLCSIPDVERAVAEVYRVLKPNGRYLFLEHGISPDAKVQRWQRRLNWLQRRAGDGCRLDLDVPRLLDATPFREREIHAGYLEQAPATHGYIYGGQATK